MKVPLTVIDHLRRAEQVYGDRVAFVDESDQPAESWGTQTYQQMADRARAQAAGLDALKVAQGARVAVVSQDSARLLTSFFEYNDKLDESRNSRLEDYIPELARARSYCNK